MEPASFYHPTKRPEGDAGNHTLREIWGAVCLGVWATPDTVVRLLPRIGPKQLGNALRKGQPRPERPHKSKSVRPAAGLGQPLECLRLP